MNMYEALLDLQSSCELAVEHKYERSDEKFYEEYISPEIQQVRESLESSSSRVNKLFIYFAASEYNDHIKNHILGLLDAYDKDLKNIPLVIDGNLSYKDLAKKCQELITSLKNDASRYNRFCSNLKEQTEQPASEEETTKEKQQVEQSQQTAPEEQTEQPASDQNFSRQSYATSSEFTMNDFEYSYNDVNTLNYTFQEDKANQSNVPANLENTEKSEVPGIEDKDTEHSKQRGYYTKLELQDLMKKFANIHNDFYSKKTHTKDEINEKRRLNYAMKKIVNEEIKALSTNKDSKQIDAVLVDKISNPVNEDDIDELATNKLAILKLFNIQASGTYEKNGQQIKLTQKQRAAISSVLVKVSEKSLQIEQENIASNDEEKSKSNAKTKTESTSSQLGGE